MFMTPYPDIDALVASLHDALATALGDNLAGLYLFGSLVTGAFESDRSDIDLLAAVRGRLTDDEFARLDAAHGAVAARHPAFRNRIEVGYLTLATLRRFSPDDEMARISPGEPFHQVATGESWRINCWLTRTHGIAVTGPPPESLLAPIPGEQLRATVQPLMREWPEWLADADEFDRRGCQGYVAITMCRTLYLWRQGELASKRDAAEWAAREYPQWAPLIRDALRWQAENGETMGDAASRARVLAFVEWTALETRARRVG